RAATVPGAAPCARPEPRGPTTRRPVRHRPRRGAAFDEHNRDTRPHYARDVPVATSHPVGTAVRLDRLLGDVEVLGLRGDPAVEINAIDYDSRAVRPGALFCCLRGEHTDGHDHAAAAGSAGAVALLCERHLPLDVTQVVVDDARVAMAQVAATIFDHPSRDLEVVGVT